MNPSDYINKYYKLDHELYKKEIGDCLCGRTFTKIDNNKDFKSIKDYLYIQYELNLIGQIFFTYFREDYNKWLEISDDYTDCRCTYESSPFRIFSNAKRVGLRFNSDELLEWDSFYINLVKKYIKDGIFSLITVSKFIEVIKKDPDCRHVKINNILA